MSEKRPITPAGYKRFQDELYGLWHVDRPKIVQEVSDAAALGDRSENAEYIYGKRKLREIDRRMRYLSELIDKLVVVDPNDIVSDVVKFGATVEVEDEDGNAITYHIVGEDEVDGKLGRISMASPIGRSLLSKKPGDSVTVVRPKGELELTVIELRYGDRSKAAAAVPKGAPAKVAPAPIEKVKAKVKAGVKVNEKKAPPKLKSVAGAKRPGAGRR